jgi:hypothetical protein
VYPDTDSRQSPDCGRQNKKGEEYLVGKLVEFAVIVLDRQPLAQDQNDAATYSSTV